jgi:hypothetical protein
MSGKKTLVIIVSSVVFCCFILFAASARMGSYLIKDQEAKSISKNALLDDINFFVNKIEEAHADPFRIISKEDFKKVVSRLKNNILTQKQNGLSLWKSYYVLEEIAAAIQDEHTMIAPPFQSISGDKLFFPITIKAIGEKIFIKKNLGKTNIPEFSELLMINDVDVRSIWEKCLKYLNSPLLHAKVTTFEIAINLFLTTLLEMHSPWKIKFRSGTSVNTATVEGISGQTLLMALQRPMSYSEKQLNLNGKEIPVLDIPNFAYGSYQDYRQFIDSFFAAHKNKEALIIDLRQNPGGTGTWGYYMLDYIAESPYKIIEKFEFKVSDVFKKSEYRHKAGKRWVGAKNGTFIPSSSNKIRNPQKKGKRFRGKTFLLVSNTTNSAGVVTAAIFKSNKMGTVIGQETGGRIQFNSDPVSVKLPKSKFEAQIPVAIFALPGHPPDRGVIPDIIIQYSIEDMKNGLDKEMEKVKELLSKIH